MSRQLAIHQECRIECRALRRFAKSHFVSLDCEPGYGSSVAGSASNEYRHGRLRLMKPPMVQVNQMAMPTRNKAPVNSDVASARAKRPIMAMASNASIVSAMA